MIYEPRHDKTNKTSVRPAKTQISLGIRPVWSGSLLCAQWVAKDPRFLHADIEDSDQTGRMPRLIRVFAGRTLILLVLSCRGSYILYAKRYNILELSSKSKKSMRVRWATWGIYSYSIASRVNFLYGLFVVFGPWSEMNLWTLHVNIDVKLVMAAPVAEWLRMRIFSALNRSSSHLCGFQPSSGHMWNKISSACGWSGVFSPGSPVFAPPYDWLGSKWLK